MGEQTEISWCDHTFNGWIGCAKVSDGCKNCYASVDTYARVSRGRGLELWGVNAARHITSDDNWRKPLKWNRDAKAAGVRRRVFCSSLSDVFEDRPDLLAPRERLSMLISATPDLDWLLLTKRPENAARLWLPTWGPNVWLGTTCENQKTANERIPHLLNVPAAVRFLSCEPLLGPLSLGQWIAPVSRCGPCDAEHEGSPDLCPSCGRDTLITVWGDEQLDRLRSGERYANNGPSDAEDGPQVHWVICGGESQHGARPMHPQWAASLRTQCVKAGVAFHFKQWGEFAPIDRPWMQESPAPCAKNERWLNVAGGHGFHGGDVWRMRDVGKKAAGRILDGRTWDEFPSVSQ